MIEVIGRKLVITKNEEFIGYIGDHRVEKVEFKLSKTYNDIDMSGFSFKLDTRFGDKKDIIDLDKTVGENIQLTWSVEESHLLSAGYVQIQIRAFRGDVEKWVSKQAIMRVGASISPVLAYPDPLPSEFAQMEQRVTALAQDALTARTETVEARDAALDAADGARDAVVDLINCSKQQPNKGLWMEVI